MVLLRGYDERGFVFYTNYQSRKGREIAENPKAALLFWWPQQRRQIRVVGSIEKVSVEESDRYFSLRPAEHRVSAVASPQSRVISSRAELLRWARDIRKVYPDAGPPRPSHWGGFRVEPHEIEFWQQGAHRLHDRIRYRKQKNGSWISERLAP
jgi:pyridoxamine 5'-phosphate oxidase